MTNHLSAIIPLNGKQKEFCFAPNVLADVLMTTHALPMLISVVTISVLTPTHSRTNPCCLRFWAWVFDARLLQLDVYLCIVGLTF